jgi:methylated-DNA-[protein]-cysteine S-methyltransferase
MTHTTSPHPVEQIGPDAVRHKSLAAAEASGADPCDLACEAMPGLLVGDLPATDREWVAGHTRQCGYCRRMLGGYERIGFVLDRLNATPPAFEPPAVHSVPRAPRAAWGVIESPVGPLYVAVSEEGLCEVAFSQDDAAGCIEQVLMRRGFRPVRDENAIHVIGAQLSEYFRGERNHFTVPLDFTGVTSFTQSVLKATSQVPFGHLATYRQIASAIGQPSATRAVGNALGRNPVPIVVPCHRIVRSDTSLGGYTGGLQIKERLLQLEGVLLG